MTAMSLAGASALAVAFGGLAAKSFSGHSSNAPRELTNVVRVHRVRVAPAARATRVAARPPILVPASAPVPASPPAAPAPSAAPAPPVAPPVVTQAPPVAVSGGS